MYAAPGRPSETRDTAEPPTEESRRAWPEMDASLESERAMREMTRLGVADVGALHGDPPARAPAIGGPAAGAELVPGYRLVERIGEGGSSEVWKAIGPGGLPVAMKFVRLAEGLGTSRGDWQRLRVNLRALELMREVRHANLLPLFGAWHRDGLLIFVMELADSTLIDRYNEAVRDGESGIPRGELLELMHQAACGIDHLNAPRHVLAGRQGMGILHRDIKPQNLLLVGGCVKVGDFGQAKLLEDTARNTGSLTAYYAPPELFDGLMSPWSDQYSLAVTYCQLRCGRLPFTGSPLQIMLGHFRGVPDLGLIPPAERPVVARALAKVPNDRWPDCRSFVAAIAGGGRIPRRRRAGPARTSDPQPAARRGPRRLAQALGTLSMAASLVSVAALMAGSPAPYRDSARRVAAAPGRGADLVGRGSPGRRAEPAPAEDVRRSLAMRPKPPRTGTSVQAVRPALRLPPLPADVWAHLPPVTAGRRAGPIPSGKPSVAAAPAPEAPVRKPRTATIEVLMPSEKAELVVRGEVGKGNPDEWYGPKRVVHTPPLDQAADYLIGAFTLDERGQPVTRTRSIRIEPGKSYEVDLRPAQPTSREIPRPRRQDEARFGNPS